MYYCACVCVSLKVTYATKADTDNVPHKNHRLTKPVTRNVI